MTKEQWISVAKGAAVAASGVVLTYLTQSLSGADFGPLWTPVVTGGLAVLANILRKYTETK